MMFGYCFSHSTYWCTYHHGYFKCHCIVRNLHLMMFDCQLNFRSNNIRVLINWDLVNWWIVFFLFLLSLLLFFLGSHCPLFNIQLQAVTQNLCYKNFLKIQILNKYINCKFSLILQFKSKIRRLQKEDYRKISNFQQINNFQMRFQSIQNNKIYRLYRQDEMERLKQKIQQIKKRKNQHLGSKQTHLLPYISPGYGFSQQRKRQIQKQNVRLEEKIKKAKDAHSTYYINKKLDKKSMLQKTSRLRYIQTLTNRSANQSILLPLSKSDRSTFKPNSSNKKQEDNKQQNKNQSTTFRKQIMRIYQQSFSNPKKIIV